MSICCGFNNHFHESYVAQNNKSYFWDFLKKVYAGKKDKRHASANFNKGIRVAKNESVGDNHRVLRQIA